MVLDLLKRLLSGGSERAETPVGLQWDMAWQSILSPLGEDRTENQDNYLIIDDTGQAHYLLDEAPQTAPIPDWPKGHRRIVVLDGMGGHRGGREIAEHIVMGLIDIPACQERTVLDAYITALHTRLHDQFGDGQRSPGAAMTLLECPPGQASLLFHIGDTRLYEITTETLTCLTIDHVPATRYVLIGHMGEEEWHTRVHEESWPHISQAFVLGNSLQGTVLNDDQRHPNLHELKASDLPGFLKPFADRRALPLKAGALYLFASDGLWHFQKPQAFVETWPALWKQHRDAPTDFIDALIKAQIDYASQTQLDHADNTTVIAFQLREQ